VDKDRSIERTQIVCTRSDIAGRAVEFVGIVQEVYRRSRQRNMAEAAGRFDSRSGEQPPFDSEGVTYADVANPSHRPCDAHASNGRERGLPRD